LGVPFPRVVLREGGIHQLSSPERDAASNYITESSQKKFIPLKERPHTNPDTTSTKVTQVNNLTFHFKVPNIVLLGFQSCGLADDDDIA
jgi:hypothetical protein